MGRGQHTGAETDQPRPAAGVMYACHPSMSVEEVRQLLHHVPEWEFAGIDEEGVHCSRRLGLPVHELVEEMRAFGDGWMLSKGPQLPARS